MVKGEVDLGSGAAEMFNDDGLGCIKIFDYT